MDGTNDRLHDTPVVYATRTISGGKVFYNVQVSKIDLRHASGGDSAQSADNSAQIIDLNVSEEKLNAGNVIVDYGYTDTNFSPAFARQLEQAFQQLSGQAYSHKAVTLTESELLELVPTILIQLAGDDDINMGLYPTSPNQVRGLTGADMDPDHPYDVLLVVPPSHYMEYTPVKKTYVNRFYAASPNGSVIGSNAMMGHDVFFSIWITIELGGLNVPATGTMNSFRMVDSLMGKIRHASSSKRQSRRTHLCQPPCCSDLTCRKTVVACLLGFFIIGMAIGNACRRVAAEKAKVAYKRVVQCPDALEEDLIDAEAPEGADEGDMERVQFVSTIETY
jgi:hypothetical protein